MKSDGYRGRRVCAVVEVRLVGYAGRRNTAESKGRKVASEVKGERRGSYLFISKAIAATSTEKEGVRCRLCIIWTTIRWSTLLRVVPEIGCHQDNRPCDSRRDLWVPVLHLRWSRKSGSKRESRLPCSILF